MGCATRRKASRSRKLGLFNLSEFSTDLPWARAK